MMTDYLGIIFMLEILNLINSTFDSFAMLVTSTFLKFDFDKIQEVYQ